MPRISVAQLYDDNREKLDLSWVAGRSATDSNLSNDDVDRASLALVGHLNFIHPNRIQVLGLAEMNYLRSLNFPSLHASITRLFANPMAAMIVANGEQVPPILIEFCEKHQIPLLSSPEHSPYLMDVLRAYLAKALAVSTTLHGVFLDVLEVGVLITGESAMGKSELALDLISRGHGLVADDIVEVYRVAPELLEGRCPQLLKDFLEVRGLGILNIRTVFGETAIRPRKTLKLIIHLQKASGENLAALDRLEMDAQTQDVLDVPVRKVVLPVAAGRNLAVLVETAVRAYILQLRGIDSTREFIERQQRLLEAGGE
ncbi:HPr(Ser) kinase/phosphatase [Leeia aquatica]|uniref:HPr kinase/phosphorylase n=1 Tax=Leeia aquatica TaxID=2725557 RepID=A0A847SD34_9NEIS|nr:HPr(Ser) kinase/phosphatase [Leeia aquatica]NLR76845.1 HPr kinase/phosphorylase [Leeia aquatica]